MFRDPVVVVESGHTYERESILAHFDRNGPKEPLTGKLLEQDKLVMTNWAVRNAVQDWLDEHPDVTPDGWDNRELPQPSSDDGSRPDRTLLMTWSRNSPLPNDRWSKVARFENDRIVALSLTADSEHEIKAFQSIDFRGLGQLRSLKRLSIRLRASRQGTIMEESSLVLHPIIWQLTSLTTLILIGNQLTSVPAEIGQLTSLKELYLDNNRLTSVPAEIGQLTSLEELYLMDNQLTSLPAEIGRLTSLKELYLGGTQLTSLPVEIRQLTSLQRLHLENMQLTSVPAEIWQLTWLATLYLSYNRLTTLPAEIGRLTSLEELDLNGNQLTSLPPEIGQLTSLANLWLHSNQLTSLPPELKLQDIFLLDLRDNPLTSVPATIRNCSEYYLDDGVKLERNTRT